MTYLNELFLDTLGCDYSKESVYRAVMACNAEYEPRMTEVSGKELRDFCFVVPFVVPLTAKKGCCPRVVPYKIIFFRTGWDRL